jgi:hypothetical protein
VAIDAPKRARTNGKIAETIEPADIRGMFIPQIEIEEVTLTVQGMSPLIVHAWSAKAQKQLTDKQTGKASQQQEARDPEQERRDACYVVPGREEWDDWKQGKYCFPASAFKHAFLYGIAQLGDKTKFPKTQATGWVFVDEDPILEFESITHRSDVGRINMGTAMPVFRPQFNNWSAKLAVGFNGRAITLEQVVSIFDLGGFSGGIGEWRPSAPKNKSGSYGRFRVTEAKSR